MPVHCRFFSVRSHPEQDAATASMHLLKVSSRAYHACMKTCIAPNGNEVAIFETPSGVKGCVDTSIPQEALDGLQAKLEEKLGLGASAPRLGQPAHPSRHTAG